MKKQRGRYDKDRDVIITSRVQDKTKDKKSKG